MYFSENFDKNVFFSVFSRRKNYSNNCIFERTLMYLVIKEQILIVCKMCFVNFITETLKWKTGLFVSEYIKLDKIYLLCFGKFIMFFNWRQMDILKITQSHLLTILISQSLNAQMYHWENILMTFDNCFLNYSNFISKILSGSFIVLSMY